MTADLNVALVGGGAIAKAYAAALRVVPLYFPDVPRLRPHLLCHLRHLFRPLRLGCLQKVSRLPKRLWSWHQRSKLQVLLIS